MQSNSNELLAKVFFFLTSPFRQRRQLFLYIILFFAFIGAGRAVQIYFDSFYDGLRAPYLQSVTTNQAVIRWQTVDKSIGSIHYGTNINSLDQQSSEREPSTEHRIKLTHLKPSTRYYYRINYNNNPPQTATTWFYTAATEESNTDLRVWVLGDPGYKTPYQQTVKNSMLNWVLSNPRHQRPDFDLILTTGDNAYRSGTNEQFQHHFFEPYQEILTTTALWPAYGNHDARRWTFFNIFDFPQQGEAGGVASGSERYYSFNNSHTHFIMLDSFDGGWDKDDDMLKWLEKDLQANQQLWTVAVMHHPPYSKGNQNSDNEYDSRGRLFHSRENILPILQKYGVDLILNGHSHSYERSYLVDCHYGKSSSFKSAYLIDKGMTDNQKTVFTKSSQQKAHQGSLFAVVGSSAKLNTHGSFDHPVMQTSMAEYGSLVLDITSSALNGRFIDDNGQIKDHFVLQKSAQKPPSSSSCE